MKKSLALLELKSLMEQYDCTQYSLATRAFVHPSRLSEILRQRRKFTPETDVKISKVFNLKSGHFMKLQLDDDIKEATQKYQPFLDNIIEF